MTVDELIAAHPNPEWMSARMNQAVTVRLEYGSMRFENDTTMGEAGDVLGRMYERHGITSVRIDRNGIHIGRVDMTGARSKATLIVH